MNISSLALFLATAAFARPVHPRQQSSAVEYFPGLTEPNGYVPSGIADMNRWGYMLTLTRQALLSGDFIEGHLDELVAKGATIGMPEFLLCLERSRPVALKAVLRVYQPGFEEIHPDLVNKFACYTPLSKINKGMANYECVSLLLDSLYVPSAPANTALFDTALLCSSPDLWSLLISNGFIPTEDQVTELLRPTKRWHTERSQMILAALKAKVVSPNFVTDRSSFLTTTNVTEIEAALLAGANPMVAWPSNRVYAYKAISKISARPHILALLLLHGMDPEVIMSVNPESPAREEASYLASLNEAQKTAHLASLAQEPYWS